MRDDIFGLDFDTDNEIDADETCSSNAHKVENMDNDKEEPEHESDTLGSMLPPLDSKLPPLDSKLPPLDSKFPPLDSMLPPMSAPAPPHTPTYPPKDSANALQLLMRSKSLMGYVQETLVRDENAFMVPGHEGVTVSTSFADDTHGAAEASNREKTGAAGTGQDVGPASPRSLLSGPPELPRCAPTIHFRAALVLMSMLIVALACMLIAIVSLSLSVDVTNEVQTQCTENVADLMETSRITLEDFARQDTISALDVLSERIQRSYLDQAVGITGEVAGSLAAIRHFQPGFSGHVGALDQSTATFEAVQAAYNASAGILLSIPLATEQSRSVRSVFIGFEETSEVIVAVEDRFLNFSCIELCTPSPNCTAYPMTAGVPDFTRPHQAHSHCVNDNFDYDQHPLRLKELRLMADNDNNPVLFWWALNDFQGDPSMLMTFLRPYDLCLNSNRTCFNALIGAQIDLQGLSCFLHEHLSFNFSAADGSRDANSSPHGSPASSSSLANGTDEDAGLSYLIFNGANSIDSELDDVDRVGTLLATSNACRPAQVDHAMLNSTLAVDVEGGTGTVARSATYVRDAWLGGAFGTPGTRRAALVNLDTLEPCDLTQTGANSSQCFFVSMVPVQGPSADPYDLVDMGNQVELLAVAVVPHLLYLQNLEYLKGEYKGIVRSLDEQQRERWAQAAALVTGIILAITILVCILSACLAWRFGASIIQLSGFMRDLETLKFSRVKKTELSRVHEISQMQSSFNDLCSTIEVMAKFVPSAVVRAVITNSEGKGRRLHVRRRNVTILFSDIAGFTSISERLSERDLLLFLVRYLTVMTAVVEAYGGVVSEILGDGVLAFWNTPDPVEDHEAKACASALAQQESMRFLNEYFAEMLGAAGCGKLKIRIGVHTGDVLTGNIGSVSRYKWGSLGDAVNLASRLEGVNKLFGTGIIISHSTFSALPGNVFVTRKLDCVAVKGKAKTVTVYELVSMKRKLLGRSTADAPGVSEAQASRAPSMSDRIFGSSTRKQRMRETKFMSARLPLVSAAKIRGSFRMPRSSRTWNASSSNDEEECEDAVTYEYGPVSDVRKGKLSDIEAYERALDAFQRGQFAEADEALHRLTAKCTTDRAAQLLQARIDGALVKHGTSISPSNHEWDGVLRLHAKEF
ncbi:Adenylate cyclase, terminal-differentiation specific [Hondaea fermentalgiana]|uniref:Adenylate cyclase, terminal-differentiation specific n=1 Tax=Hondaea fermentalgiana TaxID=2315210 RepID=A0A2R5GZZ4_9STRA|nr:Adenylate cyclase, terminal-differentiation specific [Hondaea fermentalgiana]|eukprot:GBG34051.1 Adenylate cyclase, terminal-differentiation specific [Hondaea fermentalgiana]